MVFIADASQTEIFSAAAPQTYNYASQFMNMILILGFIIGLIFVSVYILKRIMRSRLKQLNRSTAIKVLERRSLTPKASLYLVDVLGKGLVIAESPSGIYLITEFGQDVDVELLLGQIQQENVTETFASKLKKLATRNG